MPDWSLPKDKNYPADAVQCNSCGGWGDPCSVCRNKGWLPAGHPSGSKCARVECSKPLPPNHVAVYCSNECAFADA